jgi:hypothetical protein
MFMRIGCIVLAAVTALEAQVLTPKPGPDGVQFLWAVGGLTGPRSARTLVKITEEVTLSSGDELKMYVSMVKPGFLYIVHEDPAGAFSVLFPELTAGLDRVTTGTHYIPPQQDWFELDTTTGIERVYLVASSARLATLEKLLAATAAAQSTTRSALGVQIVNELARLQKTRASSAWSERPVAIAGQVRGVRPDVAQLAAEIAAPEYFSRVIVVDHR